MTPLDTEKDIIQRLKVSDEKAMAPIFKLFHKSLCYFATQLVNKEEDAEDIVAGSFLKLWQRHQDFDSLLKIRNFLYIVTRHSCYDHLKHLKRKTASHEEMIRLMEREEDYIESKMIKAELLQTILLEVETLPPIRRKIFKMIYVEDLSVFEIANQLKISVDTVRVQKARALHLIRSLILRKGMVLLVGLSLLN
jgi:RNA polymerase sigma-70 factor (ECF subfamily)